MDVETSNVITLRGSTEIVTEFFEYSVNSILYQRGIYPPESFKKVAKYGLAMMLTTDEALAAYLTNIMTQLHEWLMTDRVRKLVLVVKGVESKETLERWVFNCESTSVTSENCDITQVQSSKSQKEITQEIQAVVGQITASVTFLPLLNEPCFFDLLVYADDKASVPLTWEDSDPCHILNAEDVRLRSFDTK
ncbi:mad2l1-1, partial [Symbiodinium microadriaticum]